jgi:hypothetical protein
MRALQYWDQKGTNRCPEVNNLEAKILFLNKGKSIQKSVIGKPIPWKINTWTQPFPLSKAEPKISQQNPGRLSHPMARAAHLTLQRKNYIRQASFLICSFTFVTVVLLEILVPKINFSVVFNKIHSG